MKENEVSPGPAPARNVVSFAVSFLALLVVIHFFGASTAAVAVLFAVMLRVLMGFINRLGLEDLPLS